MKPTLSMNSNHVMVRELKDYLMIALGMIFYGIGWTVFLLPNDLPSGAVPVLPLFVYWERACLGDNTLFALMLCYTALAEDFGLEVQYEDGVCRFRPDVFPFRDTAFDIRASIVARPTVYGMYPGGYLLR